MQLRSGARVFWFLPAARHHEPCRQHQDYVKTLRRASPVWHHHCAWNRENPISRQLSERLVTTLRSSYSQPNLPLHSQTPYTMTDNQNPGNFANRPKEEVQNIASKGGQTGTENSGFVGSTQRRNYCVETDRINRLPWTRRRWYVIPSALTTMILTSTNIFTARHRFPGRQGEQWKLREGQRGCEGGWQEGRSVILEKRLLRFQATTATILNE